MTSTDLQRWARVRPEIAWKWPGLPTNWVKVIERHPEGFANQPGYVWLDMPGKVRSVREQELEIIHNRP
jgi:hypothetical protein